MKRSCSLTLLILVLGGGLAGCSRSSHPDQNVDLSTVTTPGAADSRQVVLEIPGMH